MLMGNRQELFEVFQKLPISSSRKFAKRDFIQLRPQISVSQTLTSSWLNVRAELHQTSIHSLQLLLDIRRPGDLLQEVIRRQPLWTILSRQFALVSALRVES
jgi:hypothetical protein